MESSRDSSVWRSLAVTFGGGLALGAVGMKITQTALRPAELPSRPAMNPETDRLSRMEQRLERVERAPAPVSPGTAPVDQKVLEAVVGALEARVHAHSAQVERRLADLDARITVEFQALHQQDRNDAEAAGKGIAGLQRQLRQELADLRAAVQQELGQFREAVSKTLTGDVLSAAAAAAAGQIEERLAPLRAEVAQADTRVKALEQSVETRVVTAARFEEQLTPLRAEVDRKERELVDLRHRLTESEGAVLDVILAVGQVCREAAERIGGSGGTLTAVAPPTQAAVAPPAPNIPESPLAAPAVSPGGAADDGTAPDSADPFWTGATPAPNWTEDAAPATGRTLEQALPDFLPPASQSRWRIPLVSSILVATCTMLLVRYL
jgi:hypothetical protein